MLFAHPFFRVSVQSKSESLDSSHLENRKAYKSFWPLYPVAVQEDLPTSLCQFLRYEIIILNALISIITIDSLIKSKLCQIHFNK